MDERINTYDWAEVFGEGNGGNCSPIKPNVQPPGSCIESTTFNREDVEHILQMSEGENDGESWVIYGLLKDGRFFVARGWCDYTGWECQAGNSGDVAATKDHIIRFGLTEEERERFGLQVC